MTRDQYTAEIEARDEMIRKLRNELTKALEAFADLHRIAGEQARLIHSPEEP